MTVRDTSSSAQFVIIIFLRHLRSPGFDPFGFVFSLGKEITACACLWVDKALMLVMRCPRGVGFTIGFIICQDD